MSPDANIIVIAQKIKEGYFQEAITLADAVIASEPANSGAWYLRGLSLNRYGDKGGAITCFNTALKYKPDFKEACLSLADALEETGQLPLAIKAYEYLLKIEQISDSRMPPGSLSSANEKKISELFAQGETYQKNGEPENAAAAFRKVLELRPDMPEALTNLGNALYFMRRYSEAEKVLLEALRAKPWHADALNTLAVCYRRTGHFARVVATYRLILSHHPRYFSAAVNLGHIYAETKHYDEAIKAYEGALAIDSNDVAVLCNLVHLQCRLCIWDKAEVLRSRIRQLIISGGKAMPPFIIATLIDLPEFQLKNARQYAKETYTTAESYERTRPLPAVARSDDKLRIGYLSSDFHNHATTSLISELFEQHDRKQYSIFAYSYGQGDGSGMRTRIASGVDQFRDIQAMTDQAASELIKNDGVDILIDLKGYTENHRFGIMSRRPAPLQMHYLGFPGTTGASFVDYFITDAIASPAGAESVFSECLIRLPHTYQINDRKRFLPSSVPSRSAYGLPEDGIVFGNFNNSYKILPDIFAMWMRILKAVDGSVLWLYEIHPQATINLRREAEKHGVSPARIVPARMVPSEEHLARYRHVDLVLDTFPVCGHTTTSDALWCGVPVVAMAGETFISRVAASLLYAVGLPELVAPNSSDYEALALALACDPERVRRLHEHLEEGRMHFPLFDSAATTLAIEAAYEHVATLHRNRKPPRAFNVLPDLHIA